MHEFGNGTGNPLRTPLHHFVGRHEAAQPEPPINRTPQSWGYCSSVPGYWACCKAKYIRQDSLLCLYGVGLAQHMGTASICPLTQGPQSAQVYSTEPTTKRRQTTLIYWDLSWVGPSVWRAWEDPPYLHILTKGTSHILNLIGRN